MAININNVLKRIKSDSENERHQAADAMYRMFNSNNAHPDEFEIIRRGEPSEEMRTAAAEVEALESELAAMRVAAEKERKARAKAEAAATKAKVEKAKAEAEAERLRKQQSQQQSEQSADDGEWASYSGCLLEQDIVDAMTADQVGERMQTLCEERDRRQHNLTAKVDLVIGQLTAALYRCHAATFGKRKRGSSTPTISAYLEQYAGKSASWCRRCFKGYSTFVSEDWDPTGWDQEGGIEGLIKSASDPNKPKVKRVSKVRQKLDALVDVVRRKQWEYAQRMVSDWDNTLT